MKFDGWQYYALMVFAIVAGQIARLGYKVERGGTVSWGQTIIEASMLPAFGALGGALAQKHDMPVWMVLGAGIMAGWLGFGLFKLAAEIAVDAIRKKMGGDKE